MTLSVASTSALASKSSCRASEWLQSLPNIFLCHASQSDPTARSRPNLSGASCSSKIPFFRKSGLLFHQLQNTSTRVNTQRRTSFCRRRAFAPCQAVQSPPGSFPSDATSDTGDGVLRAEPGVPKGGFKGMSDAFSITPRTAFAITTLIAAAAVTVPFFMHATPAGSSVRAQVLAYLTLFLGFYMAWNIGANDVANAMGTSVGSGALTLRQAVMTAAVLEFAGAFLVGSHVSHTMQKGIVVAEVFKGQDTLLFCGMLSSLAAAGTWLQVTFTEMTPPLPPSLHTQTPHSFLKQTPHSFP